MDREVVTKEFPFCFGERIHDDRRQNHLERLSGNIGIAVVSGITAELRPACGKKEREGGWYIHRRMLRHEK